MAVPPSGGTGDQSTYPVMVGSEDQEEEVREAPDTQRLIDDEKVEGTPDPNFIIPNRCGGNNIIVEPLLFVFMMSQFPMSLIMPRYIQEREWKQIISHNGRANSSLPTGLPNSDSQCNMSQTNTSADWTNAISAASMFDIQTSIVSSVPAVFVAAFLGPYSDRVGRRYALIPPCVGQTLNTLNILINIYFQLPLEELLVGYFIYGLSGSWVTVFMAVISYISDITTKEQRSFRIVMAEICTFAPTILSTAGSGFWVDNLGYTWVFFIIFICNVLVVLYAIFFVPETIRRDPTARFFCLDHIKKSLKVITLSVPKGRCLKLVLLILALFLNMTGVFTTSTVDNYFTLGPPLCWSAALFGVYTAAGMAVSVVGSTIIVRTLRGVLSDIAFVIIAGSITIASGIYQYFVTTTTMMFMTRIFNVTGAIFTPTVRSIISKIVQPHEIGAVFAVVAIVEVFCSLIGRVAVNPVFSMMEKTGAPTTVYFILAAISFLATFMAVLYWITVRRKGTEKTLVINEAVPS